MEYQAGGGKRLVDLVNHIHTLKIIDLSMLLIRKNTTKGLFTLKEWVLK